MNVYDFDNTIYDGETLVDFIMFFIKNDPKIWKYVPKLLIVALKDKFNLFTVDEAVKAYASFLEGYYIHIENLEERTKKFWDENEHKIKPFYNEIRKDDDVIVSGSLDFILEEICSRIGINKYIGSVIDKNTGKFQRLCFLENKVQAFYEEYPNAKIENFYTDSINDKAMMDISENVYFIKGHNIEKIK